MSEVGAYEAKTHFSQLLERVAKGETITITKHGTPVAVLAPAAARKREEVRKAIEDILALREELRAQGVKVTSEEIRQWKHEGHRY